jgi:hypothetical protein
MAGEKIKHGPANYRGLLQDGAGSGFIAEIIDT